MRIGIRSVLLSLQNASAHAVVLAILLPVPKTGALMSYKTSWSDQKLFHRAFKQLSDGASTSKDSKKFYSTVKSTSGYATMVHGRECNPHRCTTTFANVEITSLWRHWWRHNSESIRDRQKRRPPRTMKSSELSNGENRIALQLCKTGNDVIYDVIIWVQDGNCKKWLERILVLVRSTI